MTDQKPEKFESQTIKEIKAVFFAPDRRASDLSNKWESIADLLVDNMIIMDDNWYEVPRVVLMFGGVDKDNPRVEIEIIT